MLRGIAPLALMLCLPALPKTPVQPVQVVTTEKVDFASGGAIRFEGSVGELNIEGWDEPQVQVTLTRLDYAEAADKDSLKQKLTAITLKTEKRAGNELVVTTTLPHRNYFVRKVLGATSSGLNYRVMVPRGSRLIVHHGNGDVVIYDVGGDIEATAGVGTVVVQVAGQAEYSVDARSRAGEVYTDYEGKNRSPLFLGDRFAAGTNTAAHHVYARVRIGDIDVIKMGAVPSMPK